MRLPIEDALPPLLTIEMITKKKGTPIYAFDWNFAQIDRQKVVDLSNPFDTYENPWDQWGNFVFEQPPT